MAVFQYKTRGIDDIQGKQKVYFCAHPDDYSAYLDKVSELILNTLEKSDNQNCAFFYLEDARAERDSDFLFKLAEMNLVVMPVTNRLLTTSNPALDIDFNYAANSRIPVLPLMMENGLEYPFNEKCGDIQFLDPNSRDVTSISFEEKLTQYLTSIIIGDKLAEKIRDAFDAYIFLSYRKKDRLYAQDLMRLIHKNDFCRDIAIWYDEFLTPGENFNHAIESALKKSKLFALAVTPSLLEKSIDKNGDECDNYIVTTEYPMAQDAKKQILPAELVKTDKGALLQKYKGIPDCIDTKDELVLSDALKKALCGIALRENDGDPEHNFFIGLAYLGGVDVEKNYKRAVELINSAAETGLLEAMKKLVSIYCNGEAVTRDYEKAIKWQRKVVAYEKRVYEKCRDGDSISNYITEARRLGDLVYDLSSLDDAQDVYSEMLSVSKEIGEACKERWAQLQKCYSMGFLADFELTNEEMRLYSMIHHLASSYDSLGSVCLAKGDYSGAEIHFKNGLEIRQRLSDEIEDPFAKSAVSFGYERLGDVCRARGDIVGSKEYYILSLNLHKAYAEERGMDEAAYGLAQCCDLLGDVCLVLAEIDDAERYYRDSLGIRKKYRDVRVIYDRYAKDRNVSVSFDKLGDAYRARGDVDGAEEHYLKAHNIRMRLVSECGQHRDRSAVAISHDKLGEVYKLREDYRKAEKNYLEALHIRKALAEETALDFYKRDISSSCMNLGCINCYRENYEIAEAYFREAVRINEELAVNTGRMQAKRNNAAGYLDIGITYERRGESDLAEEYFVMAFRIQENIAIETSSANDRATLADLYFHAALHSSKKREQYLDEALSIMNKLCNDYYDNPVYAQKRNDIKRELGI